MANLLSRSSHIAEMAAIGRLRKFGKNLNKRRLTEKAAARVIDCWQAGDDPNRTLNLFDDVT
jgi:hypothetical protein